MIQITSLRKNALILILALFSFQTYAGQITFQHPEKKKTYKAEENSFIKIWTNDQLMPNYKGRFTIIDSETIEIKGNKIQLKDISKIKVNPKLAGAMGIATFTVGAAMLGAGISTLSSAEQGSNEKAVGGIFTVLGSIFTGIGIPATVKRRSFKTAKDWTITIIQ